MNSVGEGWRQGAKSGAVGTVQAGGHRPELAVEVERGNIIPELFRRLSLPGLLTNEMWKEEVVLRGGRVGLLGCTVQ